MAPAPGDRVSHDQVLETLGGGGMGVVYPAEDTALRRRVALKFLTADASVAGDGPERPLREARAASSLTHPHTCTVYEIGEHDGLAFVAMEWLDGQTLKERLASGPLDIDALLDLRIRIANAVQPAWIGLALGSAGRADEAFEWLERYRERDLLPVLNHSPQLGPCGGDPRFHALMRGVGVPGRE
jgi:hypothetical protein